MKPRRRIDGWVLLLAAIGIAPLVADPVLGTRWQEPMVLIFIYAILALGLNVVVGYTGLLHLGIAAFFGIGAYVTGILTVPVYPFQVGFTVALVASIAVAAVCGLILGAPTLRLRGDYLAIVTLGFGEVVRFTLRNLEEITAGKRVLNPIPGPSVPDWLSPTLQKWGILADGKLSGAWYYCLILGFLVAVLLLLRNLERSRLGRAWVAIREDELAASCAGIQVARAKLLAFALGAALAGMAGCLYATTQGNTADPDAYDFNRSITTLCCVILGGLGSLRGVLLGVFLLIGFDLGVAPQLDTFVQNHFGGSEHSWLTFSNWRFMIFGLALILMMRLRPEGLLPSVRVKHELADRDADASSSLGVEL